MSGFRPAVRALILARQHNGCARCCRFLTAPVQIHHRRARAMGGTNQIESNLSANGLALCDECHRWAESKRTDARRLGYLVTSWQRPCEVPVWHCGSLVRLHDDGSAVAVERTAS